MFHKCFFPLETTCCTRKCGGIAVATLGLVTGVVLGILGTLALCGVLNFAAPAPFALLIASASIIGIDALAVVVVITILCCTQRKKNHESITSSKDSELSDGGELSPEVKQQVLQVYDHYETLMNTKGYVPLNDTTYPPNDYSYLLDVALRHKAKESPGFYPIIVEKEGGTFKIMYIQTFRFCESKAYSCDSLEQAKQFCAALNTEESDFIKDADLSNPGSYLEESEAVIIIQEDEDSSTLYRVLYKDESGGIYLTDNYFKDFKSVNYAKEYLAYRAIGRSIGKKFPNHMASQIGSM